MDLGNASETDDINVEEIMSTIRENVRKKHNLPPADGQGGEYPAARAPSRPVREELRQLASAQDSEDAGYVIASHRAVVGPLLVRGRKLVNGEVKRYVDPALWKQREFNLGMIRVAGQLAASLERVQAKLGEKATFSWSDFYSMEVTEKFLGDNVEYHGDFLALVAEYARKSSGGKTPRLIEVGLGTATFSVHFSRNAYDCVGIDNDPQVVIKALETNRNLGGYARFMLIDALALDLLKDGYFDVAFSQGTLEHFDNETLFRLLSRQLQVARYVVFSVPSVHRAEREFGNERKMSVDDWKVLLESAGFNVLRLDYYREKTQIAGVLGPAGEPAARQHPPEPGKP